MKNHTASVAEILPSTTVQYSNKTNFNYSTVQLNAIFKKLSDIIPDDGFHPFYAKQMRLLGYERFMELVGKARAGSDTPQRLFCWMLKNPEQIK